MTAPAALFDEHDHAMTAGWATYHRKPMRRFRIRCRLGRHAFPVDAPDNPNGYSPSNYARCARCGAWIHWYVVGQHRWGGIDAPPSPVREGSSDGA